jgi:hypothetical protein
MLEPSHPHSQREKNVSVKKSIPILPLIPGNLEFLGEIRKHSFLGPGVERRGFRGFTTIRKGNWGCGHSVHQRKIHRIFFFKLQ